MKKQLSSISLLAGTAIGSGMLSLPIVLTGCGMLTSLVLMLACVWIAYFSSIIRTELNIHSKSDFAIKDVGAHFSGKVAAGIGSVSLKLLSYSLMAAYFHGLASLIRTFWNLDLIMGISLVSVIAIILLTFSNSLISRINKTLFVLLISAFVSAILGLLLRCELTELTFSKNTDLSIHSLATAIPIVFTSFGFQGSLHSLTKFVNNDRKIIKRACIFGSVIPAIVYILWFGSTVLVIGNNDPTFFEKMLRGTVEIGDLIKCLTGISNLPNLRLIFWIISLLALLTSIIGVGIAIFDEWAQKFSRMNSATLTILPSALIAIFVPNAFIRVLGVSGMILVILAIFLPIFLYIKMAQKEKLTISKSRIMGIVVLTIAGIIIFVAGML